MRFDPTGMTQAEIDALSESYNQMIRGNQPVRPDKTANYIADAGEPIPTFQEPIAIADDFGNAVQGIDPNTGMPLSTPNDTRPQLQYEVLPYIPQIGQGGVSGGQLPLGAGNPFGGGLGPRINNFGGPPMGGGKGGYRPPMYGGGFGGMYGPPQMGPMKGGRRPPMYGGGFGGFGGPFGGGFGMPPLGQGGMSGGQFPMYSTVPRDASAQPAGTMQVSSTGEPLGDMSGASIIPRAGSDGLPANNMTGQLLGSGIAGVNLYNQQTGGNQQPTNPYSVGYGMGFQQQPNQQPMGGGKGGSGGSGGGKGGAQ